MSAKQLAEAMTTDTDTVSHDTALRCLHALDARYHGSGHIEHTGARPTDHTYTIRPFACHTPNNNVREDRIRKTAYVRTDASGRTDASLRTGASDGLRTYAKMRTYAPPIPPLNTQNKTTTTNQRAQEVIGAQIRANGGGGGGGGEGSGGDKARKEQVDQAGEAQEGPRTSAILPDDAGRTDAPAPLAFNPPDLDARLVALQAAGIGSAKVRNRLAKAHTVEEIAAAVKLAKQYGKGGGAVVHELDEGNAAEHLARIRKKATAPTPQPARIEAAREALAQHAAAAFDAAKHAERVQRTAWQPLLEALRAALRKDTDAAAFFIKRNRITRAEIDADHGTPGREKLEYVSTHPMIRAAVAAELDAIESGAPRVVPEGEDA